MHGQHRGLNHNGELELQLNSKVMFLVTILNPFDPDVALFRARRNNPNAARDRRSAESAGDGCRALEKASSRGRIHRTPRFPEPGDTCAVCLYRACTVTLTGSTKFLLNAATSSGFMRPSCSHSR